MNNYITVYTPEDSMILCRAMRGGWKSTQVLASMIQDDHTDFIKMLDREVGKANDRAYYEGGAL